MDYLTIRLDGFSFDECQDPASVGGPNPKVAKNRRICRVASTIVFFLFKDSEFSQFSKKIWLDYYMVPYKCNYKYIPYIAHVFPSSFIIADTSRTHKTYTDTDRHDTCIQYPNGRVMDV